MSSSSTGASSSDKAYLRVGGRVVELKISKNSKHGMPLSEDEKKQRSEEIRNATIGAALAPLNTASSAQKLLSNLEKQSASCNPNALTDLASASEMALSAVKIASLNVRINLENIDGDEADLLNSNINTAVEQSIKSANIVEQMVNKRLEW